VVWAETVVETCRRYRPWAGRLRSADGSDVGIKNAARSCAFEGKHVLLQPHVVGDAPVVDVVPEREWESLGSGYTVWEILLLAGPNAFDTQWSPRGTDGSGPMPCGLFCP
jgi:hypothetical protein